MNRRPLTIEFTGLPNSGKTTLIHNLAKDLRNNGLKVKIMQEDAELVPTEIPKKTWIRNTWITFGQLQSLLEIPYSTEELILLDRGYCDALFWAKFLYKQDACSKEQSESLLRILHEIVIDVSIKESMKRRLAMGGKIVLTNEDFLSFYKAELEEFYQGITCPMWYLDTSSLSIEGAKNITIQKIQEILA